jgi:hypothetical protein
VLLSLVAELPAFLQINNEYIKVIDCSFKLSAFSQLVQQFAMPGQPPQARALY